MLCSSSLGLSPLDYTLWVSFSLVITLGHLKPSVKQSQPTMNQRFKPVTHFRRISFLLPSDFATEAGRCCLIPSNETLSQDTGFWPPQLIHP